MTLRRGAIGSSWRAMAESATSAPSPERLDYGRLFDRVFYHGLDGMASKAEMGRRALDELGPAPGVFVGDRAADLAASRAIGTPFVGCMYGYGSSEELADADFLVESPTDLASLLLGASV